ncbi:hypothetical protein IV203_004110 [Nitzschia inconspicua]|uniref:Uncharacterized protein n=1 Tax=Nitzschia inconspicua TaxID=303405 RepID=A0A9K3L353_9STRA|nr:hypothetical protein IV203_004110 [Nitzschia inconspicua]
MNRTTRDVTVMSVVVRILTLMQILWLLATPVSSFGLFKCTRSTCTTPAAAIPSTSASDTIQCRMSSMAVLAAGFNSPEDEVTRQLARARAALEVSRAKLAARENAVENEFSTQTESTKKKTAIDMKDGAMGPEVPFFASQSSNPTGKKDSIGKREKVIKAKNEDGLFTTDGDLMAKLSEEEEWESRSLFEVFQNERKRPENTLADRDVAASIFNLRKQLRTDDFQRIFDQRNRFIGEP